MRCAACCAVQALGKVLVVPGLFRSPLGFSEAFQVIGLEPASPQAPSSRPTDRADAAAWVRPDSHAGLHVDNAALLAALDAGEARAAAGSKMRAAACAESLQSPLVGDLARGRPATAFAAPPQALPTRSTRSTFPVRRWWCAPPCCWGTGASRSAGTPRGARCAWAPSSPGVRAEPCFLAAALGPASGAARRLEPPHQPPSLLPRVHPCSLGQRDGGLGRRPRLPGS